MNTGGLNGSYRTNRPLTEQELAYQLRQKQHLNVAPHYQLSVIKMNSTYLESVDRWFGRKGLISAVTLISIGMCLTLYAGLLHVAFTRRPEFLRGNDDFVLLTVAALMMSPVLAFAVWALRKESFAYTHYPIRFNRKTRMVHAFRTDGTVLSVPWDQVFFSLARVDDFYDQWNVIGSILTQDRRTVVESFTLSIIETSAPDGILMMQSHWEFVRRYMEDGPETITGQVQFCLPISERRESLTVGMHRLLANNSTSSPLLWPILVTSMFFDLLTVPFRFIAMRTSKIPQWPEEVESTCAIELDDPYAIEGAPNGDRVAVFPEAARTAGVGFTAPPGNPLATKKQTSTSPRAGPGIAKKTTANAKKKQN
jgi:hypothetical protein